MTTSYRASHRAVGDDYDERLGSEPWDGYIDHWHRTHLGRIVRRRFPGGIGRHLDFACGTGRMTGATLGVASEVVGVDNAASMLDRARTKLPHVRFVCADLTTESHDLGVFDLVTAWRFFGNAEQALREAAIVELARMQQKGGLLIANNHRNPGALVHWVARLRGRADARKADGTPIDLTHRRFLRLFRRAGYRIVSAHPIGAWAWRAKLMHEAGARHADFAHLESYMGSAAWAGIAPDCVVVARKR